MESIQEPNSSFVFSKLILTPPTNSSGGNHFMRFSLNDNPLYIQTPKCKAKYVVSKTTGKRSFLDLTFTNEHEEFIQWIENLEAHCRNFIYTKRERWFDSTLEESDIENLFTSILKPMKMGKFYLLRVNIPLAASTLKIYDENENLMNLEELKEDSNIISILEFQGIKCSARGFQVEIEVKQILVLKPTNIFDKCILSKKRETKPSNDSQNSIKNTVQIDEPLNSIENDNILGNETIKESGGCSEDENCLVFSKINDIDTREKDIEEQYSQDVNFSTETLSLPTDFDTVSHDTSAKCNIVIETDKEDINSDNVILNHEESDTSIENKPELLEIDFNLEEIPVEDSLIIKQRNDVYYEMYKEAVKKAKMAKDLALSSYLEAKRIKNLYMLDDLSDDSDLEDLIEHDDNNDSDDE